MSLCFDGDHSIPTVHASMHVEKLSFKHETFDNSALSLFVLASQSVFYSFYLSVSSLKKIRRQNYSMILNQRCRYH